MSNDDQTRHSKALEAEIVSDPDEIAKIEARNGVRQFDAVADMIATYSDPRESSNCVHRIYFIFSGLHWRG